MTRKEELSKWMDEHYVQVSLTVEEDYERLKAEEKGCRFAHVFEQNGKVGIKDGEGNILLPAEYDEICPMEGYCDFAVKSDGKWGVYSALNHEWDLPCSHDRIYSKYPSPMGCLIVFSDNGKFGWTGCQFPENNSEAVYDAVYLPNPPYFYSQEYDDDYELFEARIGDEWHTIELWTSK